MKRSNKTQYSDKFYFGKAKKIPPAPTTSLTIRANKGLLHYYRQFQNLSINKSNNLLYYIQETTSAKIGRALSPLPVIFYNAHTHDLSGHQGWEKTHATITENYYFPNINT